MPPTPVDYRRLILKTEALRPASRRSLTLKRGFNTTLFDEEIRYHGLPALTIQQKPLLRVTSIRPFHRLPSSNASPLCILKDMHFRLSDRSLHLSRITQCTLSRDSIR